MLFNEMLIRDIDSCRPRPGECAFWWLGQMGFIFKTATLTIYFDPFLSDHPDRLFPAPLRAELVSNADLVLGTHDHLDHIDGDAWRAIAAASPKARFVLPAGLKDEVSARLGIPEERLIGAAEGDVIEAAGATIEAVATAHELLNDRRENMAFCVRADGVTLLHLGDTCLYDGFEAKLRALGPVDALMLPINGRDARRLRRNCIGNMTWQEAVDLAGALRPRLTIPGHYDMMEGNTENPARFAAYLELKYPDRDFWLGPHARRVMITK